MAKKFLGKVVAGAALGGAALLVGAPGIALADDGGQHRDGKEHGQHQQERGQEGEWNKDARGHVFTNPKHVKPGQKVTLGEVCTERQADPFLWSKPTGRLKLHEASADQKWGEREAGKDGEHGKHGKDARDGERGQQGKGEHGKDSGEGSENGHPGGGQSPSGEPTAPQYGSGNGGGLAMDDRADDNKDAKKEHGDKGEHGKKDKHGRNGEHVSKDDEHGRNGEGKKHVYLTEYTISRNTEPGTYTLRGSCGEGELHVVPAGSVAGGTGGDMVNKGLATGGAGAMAAAAIAGVALLRRRRTDGSVA